MRKENINLHTVGYKQQVTLGNNSLERNNVKNKLMVKKIGFFTYLYWNDVAILFFWRAEQIHWPMYCYHVGLFGNLVAISFLGNFFYCNGASTK